MHVEDVNAVAIRIGTLGNAIGLTFVEPLRLNDKMHYYQRCIIGISINNNSPLSGACSDRPMSSRHSATAAVFSFTKPSDPATLSRGFFSPNVFLKRLTNVLKYFILVTILGHHNPKTWTFCFHISLAGRRSNRLHRSSLSFDAYSRASAETGDGAHHLRWIHGGR